MKHPISVSVIGPGALGSTMIDLIARNPDFTIHSVWGRSKSDSYSLDSETGKKVCPGHSKPSKDHDLGEVVIMAVPDDEIISVARQLSDAKIKWNHRSVIHLSGSLSSGVLKPLKDCGAQTASMHPLQTFTRGDTADRFSGIWLTLQGDAKLFPLLNQLVEPFGAQTKVLTKDQKKAMHLAAVFASNYLVSLMDVVDHITDRADITNGAEMLKPIVHQTIKNIFDKGTTRSLSGPVARGDQSTIAAHLKQLESSPVHINLYQQLGLIASQIAQSSGQLDEEASQMVRSLLKSHNNE